MAGLQRFGSFQATFPDSRPVGIMDGVDAQALRPGTHKWISPASTYAELQRRSCCCRRLRLFTRRYFNPEHGRGRVAIALQADKLNL
jgi:hypothetical protein